MTIAVSGASGFVGGHLCRWLKAQQVSVRTLPRGTLVGNSLTDVLRGSEAVVHLAARAHRLNDNARDPWAEFCAANVVVTRRLADSCRAAGVSRLVFVSSAGVLGNVSPPGGFDEHCEPAPHDAYTRSKLAAEQMLLDEYSRDLDIVILRPPLVYGPGAPGNFRRIQVAVLSGWPLPIAGLDAPRSMIGVRNLCDILTRAAQGKIDAGTRMLVTDNELTSVAGLARMIADAAGKRARMFRVPPRALRLGLTMIGRAGDADRLLQPFVVRGAPARSGLSWSPPFSLAEEIAWTVRTTEDHAS